MDTADLSSPVPVNSSTSSTTDTVTFTRVRERGTSSEIVWAPARDRVTRGRKQTLRPREDPNSYLPIEHMLCDDAGASPRKRNCFDDCSGCVDEIASDAEDVKRGSFANAEDSDRDSSMGCDDETPGYKDVTAYMLNQGLCFEYDGYDGGHWFDPGSCWISLGSKGVIFEDEKLDSDG